MAGVNHELENNKQEWIKPELNAILISLQNKLEKKLLRDIDKDLDDRISKAQQISDEEKELKTQENEPNDPLKNLMKDCLGLIKCLQFEGDINFDKNNFHSRILQSIGDNFDNKDEVMHSYANTIMKVIQNN